MAREERQIREEQAKRRPRKRRRRRRISPQAFPVLIALGTDRAGGRFYDREIFI